MAETNAKILVSLLSALPKPPAKPSTTNHSVLVHLDTEEIPLTPTLDATKLNVKLTTTVLHNWPVTQEHSNVSILVQLSLVAKDLAELKTTNQSATANLVSSLPMDNVWTLMNVPSLVLVILQPFAETPLDLSLAHAQKEVLEMPEHQDVNQEENVPMTEIVQLLQLVVKEDVLIHALDNVDKELFVTLLPTKLSAHVPLELVEILGLNVDNWNVWRTQIALLEDLVFKTSVLMLAALMVSVVPMQSVQS